MQLCLLEPGCGSFTLFIFSVSGSGQDERADVHQGGEGGIWGGHVLSVVVLHLLVDLLVLLHLLPLLVRLCAAHTEGSALNSFLEKRNRLGVRPWKSCESD